MRTPIKHDLACISAILLLCHFSAAGSNAETPDRGHALSRFQIRTLPGGYFYPAFLEDFNPDATFLIEESNGFSLVDIPRVYYEGDPFTRFGWFVDGYSVGSGLYAGAPGMILPFSAVDRYAIQGDSPLRARSGFFTNSRSMDANTSDIHLSGLAPNMGGYCPFMTFLNETHPADRATDLNDTRRKFRSNFFLDGMIVRNLRRTAWMTAFTYYNADRQFNDFNARDTVFREPASAALFFSKYSVELNESTLDYTLAYNRLKRGGLFAELGRLPQETYEQKKTAWFLGTRFTGSRLRAHGSLLMEREDLSPQRENFSKDLMDNDGEGFFPFERWGSFSSLTLSLGVEKDTRCLLWDRTNHRIVANVTCGILSGREETFEHNAILFDGTPDRVILWGDGESYRNSNLRGDLGVLSRTLLADWLTLFTDLELRYQGLRFGAEENNVGFFRPSYDIGLFFLKGRNPEIMLSYGRMPYSLGPEESFFLETQRASGSIHGWTDGNGDGSYTHGEEGAITGFTGGRYHGADPGLRIPAKERLSIHLSCRLNQRFRLRVKGLYKRIRNDLWVRFTEEYGHFEVVDGRSLYFFDRPYERMELTNITFDKDPFYAQFLISVEGKKEKRWYFFFSFLAHIGMGHTAFGNGPGANDIGVISESQADPNTWLNGYGRTDGDRGFVSRLYFGFHLTRRLFLGMHVKYRDGDPFAFYDAHDGIDQWIITQKTIQGENEKGLKGGPREDYIGSIGAKLTYTFPLFGKESRLYLSGHNVLDIGNELSEYVFSGGTRNAQELQIPRSLRFGLTIGL